jgi:hypothetical protein
MEAAKLLHCAQVSASREDVVVVRLDVVEDRAIEIGLRA